MPEPRSVRWKRRALTIPTMLAITTIAIVGMPVVIPTLVVADVVRGRWRLPSVRVYLFVTQYAINDSAEIVIAPWYWVLAGLGKRLDAPASIRRHERIQYWSIAVLARRAEQLLGVRLEIDDSGTAALEPGGAIVLCRHVNLLDASLPALLYQQRGYHVRSVIMAELLADPGFDLLYRRLGSIFILRENGPEARAAIAGLGSTLDASTVAVIFPEGRLYRPELLARFQAKLAEADPDRGARVARLRHVLPARPGGVGALLDAAPHADVVFIAHEGLDAHPDFRSIARNVPLTKSVRATAWRVPGGDVPTEPGARAEWLDSEWQKVDDWVDEQRNR